MARPSFYKKKTFNFKKKMTKKSNSKMTPRTATNTIKTYVNKMVTQKIAREIENKYTKSFVYIAPVCTLNTTATSQSPPAVATAFTWFSVAPGASTQTGGLGIFDLSCGSCMGERIGNKIKLKKWIIKGSIQPRNNIVQGGGDLSDNGAFNGAKPSLAGYVDVYFGRYMINNGAVNANLTNLYQSGLTDITPTGAQSDKLARINRDLYKIYYHRRFKVGYGSTFSIFNPNTYLQYNSSSMPAGEGFKPCQTFGFDVCNYICKNRVIPYDELTKTPMDADLNNCTLWATFIPIAGDLNPSVIPPGGSSRVDTTFYEINMLSYAEYEDA